MLLKETQYTSLEESFNAQSSYQRGKHSGQWKIWIILIISVIGLHFYSDRCLSLFENNNNTYYVPSVVSIALNNNTIKNKRHGGTTIASKTKPKRMCLFKIQTGEVIIKNTGLNISTRKLYPLVEEGGQYSPPNCRSKNKLAILVPYRDRERNLAIFLHNIHPFLMAQQLNYRIFVVEQYRNLTFNKGHLYNAGFLEVMKYDSYHCIVFHDLDLLPLKKEIPYTCSTYPRHMSSDINNTYVKNIEKEYQNLSYAFNSVFGGVVSMSVENFKDVNGFSNMYIGWGGEDNDMFLRLRGRGYPVMRYNTTIGKYLVLPHKRANVNDDRFGLLANALKRYKMDGLCNAKYKVISTKLLNLSTHILIELQNQTEVNVSDNKNK